jgi:hypothetical protein
VLVDKERKPLLLFENYPNGIGGERRVTLKSGDSTVEGMETLCLERKSLCGCLDGAAVCRTFVTFARMA